MVVFSLIVLTVALLAWQHFGMERVMEFSSRSGRPAAAADDRYDHGASAVTLTRRPDALVLDCELRAVTRWPSCSLQFPLSLDSFGVDLSAFDSISLDLSYEGPGEHDVRMAFRNFEAGLSTPGDNLSQKVVETQFEVPAQGIVQFPVKVLRAAPWWVVARKVPLDRSDMRIDNVTLIELAIGSFENPGHHRLVLRSLQLHGKLISQNQLLMLLIATWIALALAWLGYALIQFRSQLNRSTTRLAALSQINRALALEASELAGQAYTDSLTGALNREGLRDALMRKWRAPQPRRDAMAVVFVDLDHFKQVNDTHGHAVGDEVLRVFAAAVQREIRAHDKLVRWGGEEFLIVCSATDAGEAQGLADKLRRAIHNQIWPCGLRLTASFGVTAFQPGEDIGDTIRRADGALYRAKSNGRDCVQLA